MPGRRRNVDEATIQQTLQTMREGAVPGVHSEWRANLLIDNEPNSARFSE
jgi:hypothetical protein